MKRNGISGSAKRTMLIVLSAVLAVILVVLVAVTAYMENMLNLINRNPDNNTLSSDEYKDFLEDHTETMDESYTGEVLDPDDMDWNVNTEEVKDEAHIINIMLIGQDRRPGEGRQRSDVMILCTLNTVTKELTMTSFMRDMYIPIPGYRDDKMNAAYFLGGMKLLDKCLENSFGVHVDGNIEVDFDGFTDLIDLMGGVEIELSNSEANYLRAKGHNVHAGVNLLTGAQALEHTRNRSVGNSDFTRTERQREVISALVDKCRGMNLTQLNNLMQKALPMITTDMSNRQLFGYLLELPPLLAELKINNQRIPADGTFRDGYYTHAGQVLIPDLKANRELLKICMADGTDKTVDN